MSGRRILVVAAHPDDEVLGCGGTIALHSGRGDSVTTVIVCEGESHRYAGTLEIDQESHSRAASSALGVADLRLLRFPDQRLDRFSLTEVIAPLEQAVDDVRPQTVYCQFGGDVNRDHHMLFEALLVATRPVVDSIEEVLAFDTASSTEWAFPRSFVPDTWIDISSTLERKLEAMRCYSSEIREYPHPRSLQALEYRARAWGNQVCLDAAEPFVTVRRVVRHG